MMALQHSKIIKFFVASIFLCLATQALINHRVYAANKADHQFMADVNGDLKDDAIVFFPQNGEWWVSLASGDSFTNGSFSNPSKWIGGYGVGSSKQFMADVTCDGQADAVVYFTKAGNWYVAPSRSNTFTNGDVHFAPYKWLSGSGVGSTNQMLADQHGNGCANAFVTFANGAWWEYDSPGASAWTQVVNGQQVVLQTPPNERFKQGHGVGSSNQFVGDVTGDDKADAVAFFEQTGCWYVAPYNGSVFGNGDDKYFPQPFICNYGKGSEKQYLVNNLGDDRLDAVVYFGGGKWGGAPATGGCRYSPGTTDPYNITDPQANCFYYGYPFPIVVDENGKFVDARLGLGSDNQVWGDPISSDGLSIKYPFVFFNKTGSWYDRASNRWIQGLGAGSL